MVTDNSNFCRFRLSSFFLPSPPGEEKHNYCFHRRGSNHFMLFFPQFKLPGMLAYLQTTGYLRYSVAYFHVFESVLSVSSVHLMMNGLLLPWEIFTCKTLYITSKANKTQTRYQLYQELYLRVHTSCYFKAHTFQTEQIKLSPEGGTSMKCLKTAAAFVLRVTIVYRLPSIN